MPRELDLTTLPISAKPELANTPMAIPPCQTKFPCMQKSEVLVLLCDTQKETTEVLAAMFSCVRCYERMESFLVNRATKG